MSDLGKYTSAATRAKKRQSAPGRQQECEQRSHGARRQGNDRPTGGRHLSEQVAQEHQPQVSQVRDEPMPSSHDG
jgi:hypothetical protein